MNGYQQVAGTGVATVGCLTGAGSVVCAAGGSAATVASADGDPTNEIQISSNTLQNGIYQSYQSFRTFKNAQGVAGEGQAWHHIVNQNARNIAKFGAERIHNTNNLIKLPNRAGQIHRQITGYYNSLDPMATGSSTLRVREWLELQSFEIQWQFGIDVLERFGGQQYIIDQLGNGIP